MNASIPGIFYNGGEALHYLLDDDGSPIPRAEARRRVLDRLALGYAKLTGHTMLQRHEAMQLYRWAVDQRGHAADVAAAVVKVLARIGGWRPMLFTPDMARQTATGNKLETRRIVKEPYDWIAGSGQDLDNPAHYGYADPDGDYWLLGSDGDLDCKVIPGPYGGPGDWVYGRERWSVAQSFDKTKPSDLPVTTPVRYHATDTAPADDGICRPNIFQPKWASRLALLVVDVRVERLHAITRTGILREGVRIDYPTGDGHPGCGGVVCMDCDIDNTGYFNAAKLRAEWIALWDSINGKDPERAWAANPFVRVVTFDPFLRDSLTGVLTPVGISPQLQQRPISPFPRRES